MPDAHARTGRLAATLDDFLQSAPEVEAAAVIAPDGVPIVHALPEHLDDDHLGAVSVALLALGEQAATGLGRGPLGQVFVEGEHGFLFLMSARDQAAVAVVAGRSARIGFVLFELRRVADRIGRQLEPEALPGAPVRQLEPRRRDRPTVGQHTPDAASS